MAKKLCAICNTNKVGWLSPNIENDSDAKMCDSCLKSMGLEPTNFSNDVILKYDGVDKIKELKASGFKYDYKTRLSEIKKLNQQLKQDIIDDNLRLSKLDKNQSDTIREINNAKSEMEILDLKSKRDEAKQRVEYIKGLLDNHPEQPLHNDADENSDNTDKFEEIKKYKELLDSGIISDKEFNDKKSELLGL